MQLFDTICPCLNNLGHIQIDVRHVYWRVLAAWLKHNAMFDFGSNQVLPGDVLGSLVLPTSDCRGYPKYNQGIRCGGLRSRASGTFMVRKGITHSLHLAHYTHWHIRRTSQNIMGVVFRKPRGLEAISNAFWVREHLFGDASPIDKDQSITIVLPPQPQSAHLESRSSSPPATNAKASSHARARGPVVKQLQQQFGSVIGSISEVWKRSKHQLRLPHMIHLPCYHKLP